MVIGGGDAAAEEALLLARTCGSVTLLHRRDKLRAHDALARQVLGHPGIHCRWNAEVVEFLGEDRLQGVVVRDVATRDHAAVGADAAFVAIGHDPNTRLFRGQLALDGAGYLVPATPGSPRTSVPGVFAAGDVADARSPGR